MTQNVSLSKIILPKDNPRRDSNDGLASLKLSIEQHGIIEPIMITPIAGSKKYALVFGERRLRACLALGLKEIPAEIRKLAGDKLESVRMVENLQREDLNPIEEAQSFFKLFETYKLTTKEIGDRVSRSEEYVTKRLALLDLKKEHRAAIAAGDLALGHGLLLLTLKDAKERDQFATKVMANKLSVRSAKGLLQEHFTLRIADAPFPASECAACPCLSDNQDSLFEGGVGKGGKGRCTNRNRYRQKVADWKKAQVQVFKKRGCRVYKDIYVARQKHPGTKQLTGGYSEFDKKTVKRVCLTDCKKVILGWGSFHDENTLHAFCPDTPCREKTFKLGRSGGNGSGSTKSQSKERQANQRTAAATEARQNFILGEIPELLQKNSVMLGRVALYHLLEDSLSKRGRGITGLKALGLTHLGDEFEDIDYAKLLMSNLLSKRVDDATTAILQALVQTYDPWNAERIALAVGLDPAKKFIITEDYLKTFTKAGLANLAKEIGLIAHLKAKKKLPDGKLEEQKKGALVDLFLKTGFVFKGKVPLEISKLYADKMSRDDIAGRRK